jgi:hypothetical protein
MCPDCEAWKKGVEDANRVSQGFESRLRALESNLYDRVDEFSDHTKPALACVEECINTLRRKLAETRAELALHKEYVANAEKTERILREKLTGRTK